MKIFLEKLSEQVSNNRHNNKLQKEESKIGFILILPDLCNNSLNISNKFKNYKRTQSPKRREEIF